jgi:hypothetical protein
MVAKLRDMAALSFLAFTKNIPNTIELKKLNLGFLGEKPDEENFITGVCGTHSKQVALVMAAKWTREQAANEVFNRVLMVDVNYHVDNYILTREQTRRDTLAQTGWLHMDRMATGFRDEVKEMWLDWIDKESAFGVAQRLEDQSLLDIAVQHPKYVRRLMAENPSIKGIVHPVNPTLDPKTCIFAATVRYEPERFHGAVARFLPRVKVIVGEPEAEMA